MRVRFAPSPTGALHIGGARTALYNWLLARGQGGTFVLRIEDTDRERSTPENVAQILDALAWLELDWDEGPISQADRVGRHEEEIKRLLDDGAAYEDEGAVRLRVPDEGATTVTDVIRGEIVFEHQAIDDFVIARSDGSPLYNLAVAVDHHDTGITHLERGAAPPLSSRPPRADARAMGTPRVGRGAAHIPRPPRRPLTMRAPAARPRVSARLPLLHGPDGKKLSKRPGPASVQELRDAGYLP